MIYNKNIRLMRSNNLFLGLLYILFSSSITNAEPSKSIRALMKEPVSLMDWGLFHLEKRLEGVSFPSAESPPSVDVSYYEEENRIRILVTITPEGSRDHFIDTVKAKESCADIFGSIQRTLMIDPKTGKPMHAVSKDEKSSLLGFYFAGQGEYSKDYYSQIKSIRRELDSITYIQILLSQGSNEKGPKSLNCKAALTDSRMMFDEF